MRKILVSALALLILGACHGGGGGASVKTYVNRKNTAEKLTLEYRPSVETHVYNVLHSDLHRYDGTFRLETASGVTTGRYEEADRKSKKKAYVFIPSQGEKWGVELEADGSFKTDSAEWKLQTTEVLPAVLQKELKVVKIGG